jgi:hypothetical protein
LIILHIFTIPALISKCIRHFFLCCCSLTLGLLSPLLQQKRVLRIKKGKAAKHYQNKQATPPAEAAAPAAK